MIDYEAAVRVYGHFGLNGDGTPVTSDDIENMRVIVDAALGDGVLYEEPPRCLHRTLMHVHGADLCADCGAAQRWVVQVFPEVE